MGEELSLFRAEFNGALRLEAREERLTGEAGSVVLREVMERLGLEQWLAGRIRDPRNPALVTHPASELVRTLVLLFAQGWRDQDDADALRNDAALRLSVSDRGGVAPLLARESVEDERVPDGLASQPTLSRMVGWLSTAENRQTLRESLLFVASQRLKAARGGHRPRAVTLDVDSLPIEVHGHQPGSAHNGHYHARVYHPLIATVAETGDLLDVQLREGQVHTAEGALSFIVGLVERAEKSLCQVASIRMDASFPEEELLESVERAYVARVRNNQVLDRLAEPFLKRPPGRPPAEPRTWFHEMNYAAGSWSKPRRVVLVVQERPGELYLHHFWLITNWTEQQMSGEALLELYRDRGTAEGHFGELMDVFQPALHSSPRSKSRYRGVAFEEKKAPCDAFAHNEVLLLLNALAYNVTHAARALLVNEVREGFSLRRFRERVLRVPGRFIVHARRATLIVGAAAVPLWRALWASLARLRVAEV